MLNAVCLSVCWESCLMKLNILDHISRWPSTMMSSMNFVNIKSSLASQYWDIWQHNDLSVTEFVVFDVLEYELYGICAHVCLFNFLNKV